MKPFFLTFPGNLVRCFMGKRILLHLSAILLTIISVRSGFDWYYYRCTRGQIFWEWMFPAAPIGFFAPFFAPLTLIITGFITGNMRISQTGWAVAQSAALGSLISSGYKAVTGREHPLHMAGGDISAVFHFGWMRNGVFWGWPSSHTTIAFAMAVAVFTLFAKQRWLGIAALVYALYIGIGVSMTIHWFSDFAAGAIIGSAIGLTVGKSFLPGKGQNNI